MKDTFLQRALAGGGLLGAFAVSVFYVDALPLPGPPAYGGAGHAAIALLTFSGLMAGAVFFRSKWARTYAWASAIALGVFEFTYAVFDRLPAMGGPGLESDLALALGVGLMFVLLSLPDLLAPKAVSSGGSRPGVVSDAMRRIEAFFPGSAIGRLFRRLLSQW